MYVYPEREEDKRQDYQRENNPVIHSNVSTYAQVLMNFIQKIQFQQITQTNVSK